jgi:hypothetical protein
MSGNIVKYSGYAMEATDEEEEKLNETGGNGFMKMDKEGIYTVRFLPPPMGRQSPFVMVHQHFIDKDDGSKAVFACPRMMKKPAEFCPVCDRADKMKASGDPADFEAAKKFFPSFRVFANVINRDDEERGVLVLGFGKMIHKDLIALRRDTKEGGDFTNPEEDGFDILITRKGLTMKNTKYTLRPARNSTPLGDMSLIEAQPDLSRYLNVPTSEEIYEMLGWRQEVRATSGRAPAPQKSARPRRATDDMDQSDE